MPEEKLSPEQIAARIAELQRELDSYKRYGPLDKQVDVTVCIPVGPRNMRFLWRALHSVEYGHQSIGVNVHTTAQHSAIDAAAALGAIAKNDIWKQDFQFASFKFVRVVPDFRDKLRNLCESRKTLVQTVETKYLLWVDADVMVPVGGVRRLREELEADSGLGFVGIPYTYHLDHVQNGCTMMPTELAKKLTWAPVRCSCYQACQEVTTLGYKVKQVEDLWATHLSLEKM